MPDGHERDNVRALWIAAAVQHVIAPGKSADLVEKPFALEEIIERFLQQRPVIA